MNPLSAHAGAASPSTFYIDESGQGGDLVSAGPSLDFKEQPVFVLAVIGSDDEPALTDAVDAVRRRRFPQAAELKASA